MPEDEQQAVFKGQGSFENIEKNWAYIGNVTKLYADSITKLAIEYRSFREKVAIIQELMHFSDEYEQLKSDVRVKSMSHI